MLLTHMDALIDRLLTREGGYVDHPLDRGGPTNMGITLQTLSDWRQRQASSQEVEDLSRQEAGDIYLHMYWYEPKFSQLDLSPVNQELLFDAGVHHGPRRATQLLQEGMGLNPDGSIGPLTRREVADMQSPDLAARQLGARIEFFAELVLADPEQLVFLRGWMARIRKLMLLIPLA